MKQDQAATEKFLKLCACVGGWEFKQYKKCLETKNITVRIKELENKVKKSGEGGEQIDKELDELRERVRKLAVQFESPESNRSSRESRKSGQEMMKDTLSL